MKDTLNKTSFVSRFKDIRPEDFSVDALEALFDFLEECEEEVGEEMEFDPIAICCDFSEYTYNEAVSEFDYLDGIEDCETLEDVAELLNDETFVIETAGDSIVVGLMGVRNVLYYLS